MKTRITWLTRVEMYDGKGESAEELQRARTPEKARMRKQHKKIEVSFVLLIKNGWLVLMKLSWIPGNSGELGVTVMVEARE